ncbi:Hypothetical protein NTJ_08256 [Nesidiocoris tenuis]|nr:Hypothetical protein NTJ_08256 [Nesidiocoris tenuis]
MEASTRVGRPPPKNLQKCLALIKKLNNDCYTYEIRTFSFQKGAHTYRSYVVYRWVISLLCLAIFVTTLGDLAKPPGFKRGAIFYLKYFIYATNHMLTLLTIQTTLGAIIVTVSIYRKNGTPRVKDVRVRGIELFYWKLHGITVDAALVIAMGYWLIINNSRTFPLDGNNILSHAVSPVIAAVDWLITGLPHNLSDAWIGWMFMICYYLFSILYWVAGGTPRPNPLEKEPKKRYIYAGCTDYTSVAKPLGCFLALTSLFSTCRVALSVGDFFIRKYRPKLQADPS